MRLWPATRSPKRGKKRKSTNNLSPNLPPNSTNNPAVKAYEAITLIFLIQPTPSSQYDSGKKENEPFIQPSCCLPTPSISLAILSTGTIVLPINPCCISITYHQLWTEREGTGDEKRTALNCPEVTTTMNRISHARDLWARGSHILEAEEVGRKVKC